MRIKEFTKGLSVLMVILLTAAVSSNSFAQSRSKSNDSKRDSAKFNIGIPNLTVDQKAKIKKIKIQYQKEEISLQNELAEKNAHLKTIEFNDKPDRDAIYKTIDEISTLQGKIMKNMVSERLEIASTLTDEQKIYFYTHQEVKKESKKVKQQDNRKVLNNGSENKQTSNPKTLNK